MKTKIIILNGVSSVGKSSILKAFQEISGDCYYGIIMDSIRSMLPFKYRVYQYRDVPTEENKKGFYYDKKEQCHKAGEYAQNMMKDFWYVIKSVADRNRNIIVDMVAYGIDDLKMANKILDLNKHDIYSVRVICDIEKIKKRERERGDRPVGSAEMQVPKIDTKYNDLVLDSTNKSPEALAKELMDYVENNKSKMLLKL